MVEHLHAQLATAAAVFSRAELAGLPDPVARYFDFVLTPGQPVVTGARIEQTGEFAMRPGAWKPFTAVEYFSVEPHGFIWDARIRTAGLKALYIRDGYVDGQGALYGTLGPLVPIVNQRGSVQMASGELLRYLAELVLLPTALLPRSGVSWEAIDDASARVTLTDEATTVSCNVDFGANSEIVRISAMRYFGNAQVELTPWVGHFGDYERVGDMMIPISADVEWELPNGPFPYWRGRMSQIHYDFAR